MHLNVIFVPTIVCCFLLKEEGCCAYYNASALTVRSCKKISREFLIWLTGLVHRQLVQDVQFQETVPIIRGIPEMNNFFAHAINAWTAGCPAKLGCINAISFPTAGPPNVSVHVHAPHLPDFQKFVHLPIPKAASAL